MTSDSPNDPRPSADDLRGMQMEIDRLKRKLAAVTRENRTRGIGRGAIDHDSFDESEVHSSATEALQLAEMIIENSPAILFRRLAADDPKDRRMVYVSPNIARFGYQSEDFLSGRIMYRDMLHPDDFERTLEEIQSFVRRDIDTYTQIYRIVTRQGETRWVEDRTSIVEDPTTGTRYHQGIVIDIHRRKMAEDNLRRSEEKYRRIVETAGEGFLLMDKDLRVVDLNSAYARMVGDRPEALIGQKLFKEGDSEYRQLRSAHKDEIAQKTSRAFEGEIMTSDGRSLPVLLHANALRSDTGDIIGTMAFVTDMTEQKKALLLAAEVQRSLLPDRAPRIEGLDIAGRSVPCDEIGGDYFDFLGDAEAVDQPFSVVVGDITGHGVDSALLMSSARAFLRMRASQPGTITDIVTAMNQHLTDDVYATGRFMTLFYLTIDEKRTGIEWVRAGHDPALLYDPVQDRFEELKGPGMALGVDQGYSYRSQQRNGLKAGQVIVVGTDGIWEACNSKGEMFGKHRIQDIIRRDAATSAESILNKVFQEQAHFSRGMKSEDDITFVVVKIL